MRRPSSLDARLYRAALWLYPPAFRRQFSREMLCDFDEGRSDALDAESRPTLWRFRARLLADLSGSIPVQWIRSGLPLIALLSAVVPLSASYVIARVAGQVHVVVPPESADAEVIGLVLLASISVALIAVTIIFTLWFAHPLVSRRRR